VGCEHLRRKRVREEPTEYRMLIASVVSSGAISCIGAEGALEEARSVVVALLLFVTHDVDGGLLRPRHVLLGEGAKELRKFLDACHNYSGFMMPSRSSRLNGKTCGGVVVGSCVILPPLEGVGGEFENAGVLGDGDLRLREHGQVLDEFFGDFAGWTNGSGGRCRGRRR
jgi:hypothetical protein